jgi:class 3 adenylate cyclase
MADRRRSDAVLSRSIRGWLAVLGLGTLVHVLALAGAADLKLLDGGFALLRHVAPKAAPTPIAIVGIDEATLAAFPEPIALWHRNLGDILRALASVRPRAVGIDMELPERSYDFVRPGSDRELLAALLALRASAPLVIALGVGQTGRVRAPHAAFLAAAGEAGSGLAVYPLDADQRVRRFDERVGEAGDAVPTFAGVMARRLGATAHAGWIDFSAGAAFEYVPAHTVHDWARNARMQDLERAFAGRVVLIGSVLPFVDRHPLPVPLAAWESGRAAPGVLLHAQALRSLLDTGLVRAPPGFVGFALVLIGSSVWFAFGRLRVGAVVLLGFVGLLVGLGLWMLHQSVFVPISAAAASAGVAAFGRTLHDAWHHRRERERLKRSFAGYVSPNVLDLILRGELDTQTGSGRRRLCVLFADIRNFTALSEHAAPEAVVDLLNAYFERMTRAIHCYDGTVDNFRGDGIMCFFGAPQASANPCRQGFLAGARMLAELDALNRELGARALPPLRIGLSLAFGEAIVGRIGAAERHEYTAIGDVANVSARLEGMTKELGYPVLLTDAVVAQLGDAEDFDDLGTREIRGHAPVHVFGWPARSADGIVKDLERVRAHHG